MAGNHSVQRQARTTELELCRSYSDVLIVDVNGYFVANCVPLLIQQNINGSSIFNRSWAQFKVGFNDSGGNYWLGNELIHRLTFAFRYKLRFDLQSHNTSNWYYAEYSSFRVLGEEYHYRLHVDGYSGNAGDAFGSVHHNQQMFTTYDRDNDRWAHNCAAWRGGAGFWYGACDTAQINVSRVGDGVSEYFSWNDLPGGSRLQTSRMSLQCK